MKKFLWVLLFCMAATYLMLLSESSTIDLVAKAPQARWLNDRGILNLPFPGNPNDPRGFVRILTAQLEDGQTQSNVLQTHPRWAAGGSIEGRYPLTLPESATFEAVVGFIQGAAGSDGVTFEVLWREKGKGDNLLARLEEKYDGKLSSFQADLSNLAGQTGLLILRVKSGQSSAQDWAAWKTARILTGLPGAAAPPPEKEKPQIVIPSTKVTKQIPSIKPAPINRIEEAVNRMSRYRLKAERTPAGLQWQGIVDEQKKSLYFRLSVSGAQDVGAEFYQVGNRGYGRPIGGQRWLKVRVGEQFPRYLLGAVEVFKQGEVISTKEDGQLLKYEIQMDNVPPRDNPEQFYRSLFKQPRTPQMERMINRMIEASRNLKVGTSIWLSAQDHKIKRLMIENESPELKATMEVTVDETREEVPSLPKEALDATDPEIPLSLLLFRLPEGKGIGGWSDFTHCSWPQRSLKLIEDSDDDHKYEEIYRIDEIGQIGVNTCRREGENFVEPAESEHPLLIGAYYEDQSNRPDFYATWLGEDFDSRFIDINRPQYNHYGGENLGVPYRWYYELWPPFFSVPDRQCAEDRFFSARDWGYGGSRNGEGSCSPSVENFNRLTFTEAIKQYNKFTLQGKKNAYIMLGHVMHLLQDQAEPDHALLVPHPGSGYTEERAYNEMHVCEILAVEAALLACNACWGIVAPLLCFPTSLFLAADPCAHSAFLIAEGTCRASIDENEVGFEWLVDNRWDISQIEARIRSQGPLTQPDYDSFFRDMAQFAIQSVETHGLSSDYNNENSLGTGHLPVEPPIPAADPNIDMDNTDNMNRYLAMTDDLATQAICLGAGFIKHFYELVNPPPYVERVTISQDSNVRLDVAWQDIIKGNNVVGRERRVRANYTLYHGIPATITVWFGPQTANGRNRKMQPGTFSIGQENDQLLGDREGDDWVLRKSFAIPCVQDLTPLTRTIRIDATDNAPHLSSRAPYGNALDKDPLTVASADFVQPYNWQNYELGGPPGFDPGTIIKIGIPPAFSRFDEILGTDSHSSQRWTIRADRTIRASMSIVEQESNKLVEVGPSWQQCGRYSLYLPPTIEHIGYGPSVTPSNGGFRVDLGSEFDTPVSGPPSQFGLTISVANPLSNQPTLTIQVAQDAPSGLYRLPIIINYEFPDGQVGEVNRFDLELQVRNQTEGLQADRASERAADLIAGKELARAKKLGFLDLREGPLVAFDPCKSGVASPDFCFLKDPLKLATINIIADKEAVFISADGKMSKISLARTGIGVNQDKQDPRTITLQAGPQAVSGVYLLSFKVMAGGEKLDEFLAMLSVRK